MRGALALALVLVAGCKRTGPPPALPFTEDLMAVGDPVASEKQAARERLATIAGRVEERLRQGRPPAEALNETIFDALGFAREIDDGDPRFMRLATVLMARRGSCLGLGALYLALGERLGPTHGFSVSGVLVPGHFFVRVTGAGGARDIELLRRGEQMPEAWYRGKYAIPDPLPSAYLRPLQPAEVLAVFDYNLGNDLRRQGRLPEAAAAYQRATRSFPRLAEAHASLGLVRHLSGALGDAERAYQAARAANPRLPGIDRNLAAVREELGRDGAASGTERVYSRDR